MGALVVSLILATNDQEEACTHLPLALQSVEMEGELVMKYATMATHSMVMDAATPAKLKKDTSEVEET